MGRGVIHLQEILVGKFEGGGAVPRVVGRGRWWGSSKGCHDRQIVDTPMGEDVNGNVEVMSMELAKMMVEWLWGGGTVCMRGYLFRLDLVDATDKHSFNAECVQLTVFSEGLKFCWFIIQYCWWNWLCGVSWPLWTVAALFSKIMWSWIQGASANLLCCPWCCYDFKPSKYTPSSTLMCLKC